MLRLKPDSFSACCFFFLILSFFLKGDFLVHFMDIAREELSKNPKEVSSEKLQVLI